MKTFCGITTDGMLDYLAAIYKLGNGDGGQERVTTSALAELMHVSAAAASSMLKRLEESGFVERSNVDGIVLTEQGRLAALQLVRRHRLLAVFLVDVMGFTWDETHEHADDLSAGLNDRLTERMAEMTGQPTRCPHGEPIPDREGRLPVVNDVCIVNLGVGHRGAVSRVRTHEPEKLRYFASLGLVPGVAVEIMGRAPFNGPMRLRVGREDVVIGYELMKSLWVT